MKTSFVALLTMAVGAFAGPIAVQRDTVTDVQGTITFVTLTESVRTYTAQISKAPDLSPLMIRNFVADMIFTNYRQDP